LGRAGDLFVEKSKVEIAARKGAREMELVLIDRHDANREVQRFSGQRMVEIEDDSVGPTS
jgi:hypothetical protein